MTELEVRNQELMRALATLAERQAETDRLNAELNETNRGVLALYAELDDRATELARVSSSNRPSSPASPTSFGPR